MSQRELTSKECKSGNLELHWTKVFVAFLFIHEFYYKTLLIQNQIDCYNECSHNKLGQSLVKPSALGIAAA